VAFTNCKSTKKRARTNNANIIYKYLECSENAEAMINKVQLFFYYFDFSSPYQSILYK